MKKSSVFLIVLFMSVAVGCSSVYKVRYDYDESADFSSLKTYNWLPFPEKKDVDEFAMKRIQDAVDMQLAAKGLQKVSDTPDFSVRMNPEIFNIVYTQYQYEQGRLILDFVDSKSNKLLWQGSAEVDIDFVRNPEQSRKMINEVVQKILEKYPPPSK